MSAKIVLALLIALGILSTGKAAVFRWSERAVEQRLDLFRTSPSRLSGSSLTDSRTLARSGIATAVEKNEIFVSGFPKASYAGPAISLRLPGDRVTETELASTAHAPVILLMSSLVGLGCFRCRQGRMRA